MNKKVYIIVLNWNGTGDTIECLKSIKNIHYDNYQIILVDNNSKKENYAELNRWCNSFYTCAEICTEDDLLDGKIANIENRLDKRKSLDRILIIENKTNHGFAKGNNIAINYVLTKKDNAYTLLLNNDTVVEPEFLDHLVDFLDTNQKYSACTPQIRLYEPNDTIWNCGGKILLGNRKYYYCGTNITTVPQLGFKDISFVTGCALFFKPQETGVLSEQFFFGEEDFEFSLRLKRTHKRVACVFNSVIYHKVGQSISKSSSEINKMFLFYASRFINHKNFYRFPYLQFIFIINTMSAIRLLFIRKVSVKKIYNFVSSLYSFVKHNKGVDKNDYKRIIDMTF